MCVYLCNTLLFFLICSNCSAIHGLQFLKLSLHIIKAIPGQSENNLLFPTYNRKLLFIRISAVIFMSQ